MAPGASHDHRVIWTVSPARVSVLAVAMSTDLGDHMRPVFRYAVCLARNHDAKVVIAHLLGSTVHRLTQISRIPVLVIPVYEK